MITWTTALLICSTALGNTEGVTSPAGSWSLNESSGTVVKDISGNKLDGKYLNIDKIEWVDGPQGKAPYFKNTGAQVEARAMASVPLPEMLDLNKGFTLTAKVKTPKELHRSRQYEIFNCSDTYSKGAGFRVYISWGMIYFISGNGEKSSFARSLPANSPIRPDSWYNIATTFDGQNVKVYMDGELVAEAENVVFAPAKRKELRIGATGSAAGSGYGFEGIICSTALYARSLSEVEIADLCHEE